MYTLLYYIVKISILPIVNILSETYSLLILESVSPYSEPLHFAATNGVHYMESLLYTTSTTYYCTVLYVGRMLKVYASLCRLKE